MSALASAPSFSGAAPANELPVRLGRLFAHGGLVDRTEWERREIRRRANKPILEVLGQDVSLDTFRDFFLAEVNPWKFKARDKGLSPRLTDMAEITFDELARMLAAHKTPPERLIRTLEAAGATRPGAIRTALDLASQAREEPYAWLVRHSVLTPDTVNRFFASESNALPQLCSLYIGMSVLERNGAVPTAVWRKMAAALPETDPAAASAAARLVVPLTSAEILERAAGMHLPEIDAAAARPDPALLDLFPSQFVRRHLFLPISADDARIVAATDDPLDLGLAVLIKWITGKWLDPAFAPPETLIERINECYGRPMETAAPPRAEEEESAPAAPKSKGKKSKKELAAEAAQAANGQAPAPAPTRASIAPSDTLSAVQLVSSVFESAIDLKATDIHLEPSRAGMTVRYRIDGVLCRMLNMPDSLIGAVVSRIKVLAAMDVTERRRPQDGHITLDMDNRHFDFRIATLPTVYGEKVAVRVLDSARVMTGLAQTGLTDDQLGAAERLIRLPYGVVLVAGPTGSGKTSTLYAALGMLNNEKRHLVTIEDPVEYQLPGINQVQVDANIGLDFSEGLRAILRQDPNIIMVGEIRDPDTAAIAMRAALTGHLVFSTIHTNSAIGAFQALAHMGATPYMIGSAVAGVISQRLVRRLCPQCARLAPVPKAMASQLGIKFSPKLRLHRATGCSACLGTGYAGRVGIFEVLEMTEKLRRAVLANDSPAKLADIARAAGAMSLREAGLAKAKAGITSPEDVIEKVLLDS